MNRYVIAGLLADMRAGRSVLVVTESRRSVRELLDEFAEQLQPGELARRANGQEAITTSHRGGICFHPTGGSLRGLSVDVCYLDVAYVGRDLAAVVAIVVAGSVIGEVVTR